MGLSLGEFLRKLFLFNVCDFKFIEETYNNMMLLLFSDALSQVLMLCFKLYGSREQSIHSTAGVVIRQVVSSMFERLNSFMSTSGSFDWGDGKDSAHSQLPMQASDAYLLFQVGGAVGGAMWDTYCITI